VTAAATPAGPRARRARPQRYQLGKRALGVLATGHPWIFRGLMSGAADALADGQWLALYDGANQLVGHGVFAAEGAIAIRVVARGPARPRGVDFAKRIDRALGKRARLRLETDGFRAIHGESDELPGVVVDVYGDTVVAQAYGAGLDALARFAGRRVAKAVGAPHLVLKAAHRRVDGVEAGPRALRGQPPELARFREGPRTLAARPLAGQKSGAFLDLRGLRRYLSRAPLAGKRVLNLFAYTGTLGQACEAAGAAHVTHVDRAADALAFAAQHHATDPARHAFIVADVFAWLKTSHGRFDAVIVDPPSMTSRIEQVPGVLATYRRLHAAAATRVMPDGLLVLACCTSRISRAQFRQAALATVGTRFTLLADLPAEADHPIGFAEADYLKVLILIAHPERAGA